MPEDGAGALGIPNLDDDDVDALLEDSVPGSSEARAGSIAELIEKNQSFVNNPFLSTKVDADEDDEPQEPN